jgi:hypothetical protein
VLRFCDELAVVIESKVVGRAPTDQARLLRLGGVEVQESNVVPLDSWHELLEDWWALLERGLLGPAEQVLMEDLIALAEEHFPGLLPFRTLGLAGGNNLRRQRRLMAVLQEATGIADVKPERPPWIATVMLDKAIRTKSTKQISLQDQAAGLALYTFPAELKPQAEAIYRTGRAQRLLDFLAEHPEVWQAVPNAHVAYRGARGDRLSLHRHSRPLSTSSAGWKMISPGSGRTATTRSRRTCGPGSGSASTPAPKIPRSVSTHSSRGSAAATPTCVPAS